jgi:hypothetical protein
MLLFLTTDAKNLEICIFREDEPVSEENCPTDKPPSYSQ